MHLFYSRDISDKVCKLDADESLHCCKVLRLKEGVDVQVTDGKGNLYLAEITVSHPKNTLLLIKETLKKAQVKSNYLHIAIAPTKNMERLEWFTEKATEIGVDEITPIVCEKSERKVVKIERLEKILLSAMKQSLHVEIPELNEQIRFKEILKQKFDGGKFIAHCHLADLPHLKNEDIANKHVLILIGPEGDFSMSEVNEAKKNGFKEISLGKSRLRTETAGILACHIVNLAND